VRGGYWAYTYPLFDYGSVSFIFITISQNSVNSFLRMSNHYIKFNFGLGTTSPHSGSLQYSSKPLNSPNGVAKKRKVHGDKIVVPPIFGQSDANGLK